MRAIILYCLLALPTLPAQVIPAAAADPVSWPDRGPYQKVGRAGFGAGRTKIPRRVVAAMRRLVRGDPSTWFLDERYVSPDRKERVVCIDGWQAEMCLLVARRTWTNLNAPASLPSVNLMLGSLCSLSAADLQDHRKLQAYLLNVTRLQRCLDVVFLDPEFRRKELEGGGINGWLQGTEKNPRALLTLCRKWVMTKTADGVTVCCNVMNGDGGVERWTFHLRVDKTVWLEGLDVQELFEDRTFSNSKGNFINLLHI